MRRQTSRHSVVHKPPRQIRFTFFPSGFALKAPFPNVAAESTANGFQRLQNPAPPYPVKKSGRGVFLCGNNPPLSATKTRQKSSSDRLYIPIRRTDTLSSLNPRLSDKTPSAAQRFLCGCRRSTFPPPLFKTKFITFFASFYTAAHRLHAKQLYFESFTAAFTIFLKFISLQAMAPYKVRHGQRLFCGCIFAIAA